MDDAGGGGPPAKTGTIGKNPKIIDERKLISKTVAKVSDQPVHDINEMDTTSTDKTKTDRNSSRGDPPVYRYDGTHKGPFMVYVDAFDGSGLRKYLNGITVTRLLVKLEVRDVCEVAKIGFGRCKVVLKNYAAANALADDKRMMEHGLAVKIFAQFVSKVAIIFDIPTDLSEDEFMEGVSSTVEIMRCIRITRKGKDGDGNEILNNTRNMKIIFKGNEIPKEIYYSYIRIPVKHFVSFAQCYRCFRYNHFAQHCKSNVELCRDCYNQHNREAVCGDLVCVNC